jgi:hypothetical protein
MLFEYHASILVPGATLASTLLKLAKRLWSGSKQTEIDD